MTLTELLPIVSTLCAVVAAACAVMVARRSQRWRDTDEAQKLLGRIDDAESRLDRLEVQTRDLPTKADLAAVKAELHAVGKTIDDGVMPGIRRLEGYWMERATG